MSAYVPGAAPVFQLPASNAAQVAIVNGQATVTISGVAGQKTTLFSARCSIDTVPAANAGKYAWISAVASDVFAMVFSPVNTSFNLLDSPLMFAAGQTADVNTSAQGANITSAATASWVQF